MAADTRLEALAPAKVNLTLHLCGQRADGYHLLDSLVVFPGIGDHLSAEPAETLSLSLSGPFADSLSAAGDNLVLKAAERLAAHAGGRGAALHLVKSLPVASGIGGGSTDAATALGLLARLWQTPIPADLPLSLGADVPVCCAAPQACRMQGIGERLTPVGQMPEFWLVLVNPLIGVPTGQVFAGVADRNPPAGPPMPEQGFRAFDDLCDWLRASRNDLQAPAIGVCPVIDTVLLALSQAPVARMSGSGATCFAVVETQAQAIALAEQLRTQHDWWVAAGPVPALG